jgi:predicted HAD superfamily Cof-like phosphohydrolase
LRPDGKSQIQIWVESFHKKYHHYINTSISKETELFRARLIAEESAELLQAFAKLLRAFDLAEPIEIADALGDLEVVINGTAVTFGFPLEAIVEEIHKSNMTKSDNFQGKPTKGPDFRPPDILAVLKKYWPQIEEYGR